MQRYKKHRYIIGAAQTLAFLAISLILLLFNPARPQGQPDSLQDRQSLLAAAKELMASSRYCALITLDGSGQPQARTMDPFPPENDMTVWFDTNPDSRKVKEIENDSRVTLYYQAPNGVGYVVIKGHAFLVNDADKKNKYWKEEWERFYPDKRSHYLLIKTVPDVLEIVSYKHNLTGDLVTWKAPTVIFKSDK